MRKICVALFAAMLSIFVLNATPGSPNRNDSTTTDSIMVETDSVEARLGAIQVQISSALDKMNKPLHEQVIEYLSFAIAIAAVVISSIGLCVAIKSLRVAIESLRVAFKSLHIATQSLKYDKASYEETKRTADNVLRASFNVQKGQFDDLIRHLYRNLVCTLAFSYKLLEERNAGGETYYVLYRKKMEHKEYPSEEHLLKLKVLPEDVLHLESYNQDYEIYQKMHELKLQLRNYDMEIDIAMTYLKDGTQDNAVIMGKLDALTFKPLFLISTIVGVVKSLDKKESKKLKGENIDEYQNAASVMTRSHVNNLIDHQDSFKINKYLDLNLRLPLEKTGKTKTEKNEVKEPYNGLARAYNKFFKEVIDADEKKVKPNEEHTDKTTEDKEPVKDYVTHSERFKDKKPDDYKTAIEGICGTDNSSEATKKLEDFKNSIIPEEENTIIERNFPFKENFLTMLSIDVTIELSKIHMIDIN